MFAFKSASLTRLALAGLGVFALTACNLKMNAKIDGLLESDKSQISLSLSSLVVNSGASLTNSSTVPLSAGTPSYAYTHYCIQQNDTDVSHCSWTAGALPANVNLTGGDGAKTLSVWIRDANGTVSERIDSNTITLDQTAPDIASVSVTSPSPTASTTLSLSYGAQTGGTYSQYCIQENSTAVGSCSWQTGTLPNSYDVSSAAEGDKVLSVWIRDAAGNVSARRDTGTVVYRTLVATYGLENDVTNDLVLTGSQNRTGVIYYAVYNANQGTLTGAQVKTAATGAVGGALVKNGSLTIAAASTDYDAILNGLAEKVLYTVYAVGEDSFGLDLDSNVKKYSGVLPKKFSQGTYNTAVAGKGGIAMRYTITVPLGYYDSGAAEWPMLVYVGGGGETFTDATNAETNYYTGNQRLPGKVFPQNRILAGVDDIPMITATIGCNASFWNCTNMGETSLYNEFFNQLKATYRINPKRFYAIGMSWGGSGIWNILNTYPNQLTAAVAVAGANGYNATTLCNNLGGTRDTPIWAIIGNNDPWFDETNQQTAIDNVNACASYDGDARYTLVSNTLYPMTLHGHNIFEMTVNSPYYNFSNSRFEYWNGSASVADSLPYHRVDINPQIQAAFATASTELGITINQIWDWLANFADP